MAAHGLWVNGRRIAVGLAACGALALGGPVPAFAGQAKLDICHFDGDGVGHLISIADPAYDTHEKHGDYLFVPEVCDGVDNDCNGQVDEVGGCPVYVDCPAPPDPPPAEGVCEVTTVGTGGLLLRGTVLTPNRVLRNGEVLIDAEGVITCVDCDCSGAPGAAAASVVSCPDGVISPALINTHDHLMSANNAPVGHGSERYNHRHDWRLGLRGHAPLVFNTGATADEMRAAELRFVMSGATSTLGAGAGATAGLLRNLHSAANLEGLPVPPAVTRTFPLRDASGILNASGCAYGANRDLADDITNLNAYLPHVAEGIDAEAHNEFLCTSTGAGDLIEPQTALVHAVGITATDAAEIRANLALVSWAPRSNIDLLGNTAPVTVLHTSGVPLTLGTDWIVTGSMTLLRELRCADDLNALYFGGHFSDFQLWQMVTTNAAFAAGVERGLGQLKPGYVADITIFDGRVDTAHRAVIAADPEDVILVLRGGQVLYGDAALVASAALGGAACEPITVCGLDKRACVAQDTGGAATLAGLEAAAGAHYPLFFCGAPTAEPSCLPFRVGEYELGITAADIDGDGIPDVADLCPTVFDPIRPMDEGAQANADGDLQGDACDPCPIDPTDLCAPPDADDLDDDGWPNGTDNCPHEPNPTQADTDGDGHGDACDACPDPNPGLTPCVLPLAAVRDPSHPDHPAEGTIITIEGVYVTGLRPPAATRPGFYVQEDTLQPFTGIFVHTSLPAPSVATGNRLNITGTYEEFFGLGRLTDPMVTIIDAGTTLPFVPMVVNPVDVATGGALAEGYESMVIQVHNVVVTVANPDAPNDFDEFQVTGALRVDDLLYPSLDNTFPVDTTFQTITGIHGFSFGNHKLLPRSATDLTQ